MLIGIDASRANRQFKTGTEWYSFYLIQNLADLDKQNNYILYVDKPLEPSLQAIVDGHSNFQAKILHWPFSFFWTLGRLSWEMLIHPPKVLFVPAHSLPLIRPKKTITTIHDIAFKTEKIVYDDSIKKKSARPFLKKILISLIKHHALLTRGRFKYEATDYLDWSTRYALRHAKRIIAVSEFTKQELIRVYKADESKISVVYNGYNQDYCQKLESEKIARVLDNYGLGFPYILYVGRLEKKKNIKLLIESFALLKEKYPEIREKLLLIGLAGYGYDELKYVIEEYNLNREVIIMGWIPEIDLPAIYQGARVFVFPSRHEGFGIPVLQAMASGVPVISSDIPVLREVAGEAAWFFPKDNKYELVDLMFQALTSDLAREELVARGYQRAKSFSWQRSAQETLNLILSL